MSETATGVKWDNMGEGNVLYRGYGFSVRVVGKHWYAGVVGKVIVDNYAPDHATAKRDAERWILEREGRLPAPATDGGWIACSERLPEIGERVEVIYEADHAGYGGWRNFGLATHWRPLSVDPHAVAACLFGNRYPTLKQIRAAVRHVAGCEECRKKLEEKGGE